MCQKSNRVYEWRQLSLLEKPPEPETFVHIYRPPDYEDRLRKILFEGHDPNEKNYWKW